MSALTPHIWALRALSRGLSSASKEMSETCSSEKLLLAALSLAAISAADELADRDLALSQRATEKVQ